MCCRLPVVGKVMRVCVRVILLATSVSLAACGAVDHAGDMTNSVFANGKLPVAPNPPIQAENISSEPPIAESAAIEEELERPAEKPHRAVRRPKSAQANEPRRSVEAPAPTTPPLAAAAPAVSPATAPPPAKPASATPAAAAPATTAPPATPASATPAPAAAQATPSPSAAEPPRISSQAEPKQLNTPWPEAPSAGTFAH